MTYDQEVEWRVKDIAEAKQIYNEYLNGTRQLHKYELIDVYMGNVESAELCLRNYLRDHTPKKTITQSKLF